jgi:aromatic-L-amino-acid/L-tryptophan decarboxylase
VDPLDAIADACARDGLWMHVDAAYAGFAALEPRGRALLSGLGRADSVTLDPHKWLWVPFECGCLLARDPARLAALFRIFPEYLRDVAAGEEEVNFADYGEQLTRYARALKVWLSVRYFGVATLRAEIAAGIDRAELAERLVRESPELEVLSPAQFGILCFRVRPPGLDPSTSSGQAALDALNERVNARVNANGRFLASSTRIHGAFSLRLCVPGFRTTDEDVRALIAAVREAYELERRA